MCTKEELRESRTKDLKTLNATFCCEFPSFVRTSCQLHLSCCSWFCRRDSVSESLTSDRMHWEIISVFESSSVVHLINFLWLDCWCCRIPLFHSILSPKVPLFNVFILRWRSQSQYNTRRNEDTKTCEDEVNEGGKDWGETSSSSRARDFGRNYFGILNGIPDYKEIEDPSSQGERSLHPKIPFKRMIRQNEMRWKDQNDAEWGTAVQSREEKRNSWGDWNIQTE